MCREVSWPFGRLVYWFGRQNSGTEITLFKILLFHLYLNKKYVKVAINDFTIHLIISKWFRRRKCRQKQCDKKMSKPKKKLPNVVDHENVCLLFSISLGTCSKPLNDVSGLHYFAWSLVYYLLHLFSSDRFAVLMSL